MAFPTVFKWFLYNIIINNIIFFHLPYYMYWIYHILWYIQLIERFLIFIYIVYIYIFFLSALLSHSEILGMWHMCLYILFCMVCMLSQIINISAYAIFSECIVVAENYCNIIIFWHPSAFFGFGRLLVWNKLCSLLAHVFWWCHSVFSKALPLY